MQVNYKLMTGVWGTNRDDGHRGDIPRGTSSPVTTSHRRCISCFRGVIVRRIYVPLKLISANNEPGREVTKGARSRHRASCWWPNDTGHRLRRRRHHRRS